MGSASWGVSCGVGVPQTQKGHSVCCLKNDDEVLLVDVAFLGLNGMEM